MRLTTLQLIESHAEACVFLLGFSLFIQLIMLILLVQHVARHWNDDGQRNARTPKPDLKP